MKILGRKRLQIFLSLERNFKSKFLLDIIENFAHVSNEKKYYYNEEKQNVDTKKFDVQIFLVTINLN